MKDRVLEANKKSTYETQKKAMKPYITTKQQTQIWKKYKPLFL